MDNVVTFHFERDTMRFVCGDKFFDLGKPAPQFSDTQICEALVGWMMQQIDEEVKSV